MKFFRNCMPILSISFFVLYQFYITDPLLAQSAEQFNSAEETSSQESDSVLDAVDLSLETLLDTVITTASKSEETSFEAPISSTVITKKQIKNSGVTSIPEALRLAPGMFVTEQTNGNYDVHIRGLNNIPPNVDLMEAANTITLVMIDGRPVFNYFSGGTIWETLPIDLNDIERIEIVRGASSALYGPNAASGVINIITKRTSEEGFSSQVNVAAGNYSTYIGNASAGYNFGDFSVIVSGNYQRRNRFSKEYYCFSLDRYFTDPSEIMISNGFIPIYFINENNDIDELYPDPDLALDKKAGNIFLVYNPDDDIKFDLSGGYQSSTAQASLIENSATSLSFRKSDTGYTHLVADIFGFKGQFSYLWGTLDTLVGYAYDDWSYDTEVVEGSLEYNYKLDKLIIRPGGSFRQATYDGGYIGGKHLLTDASASLRAEYTFFDKWRIIAALSGNKYNHPDEYYTSYQFITTYKFNDENIIRASHSKAHREAFMNKSFADHEVLRTAIHLVGDPDLDLLTIDVTEVGHRTKIAGKAELDLEVFYISAKNYSTAGDRVTIPAANGNPEIWSYTFENVDTTARQYGTSLSIAMVFNKFLFKLFGTMQMTKIYDYKSESYVYDTEDPNYNMELSDTDNKGTPGFFGGFFMNYQPIADLNVNLNGYYAHKHTFDYKKTSLDEEGNVDISEAIVLNAKVMYYIWDKSSIYINCRNILNRQERQFVGGDKISLLILGGASLEL